VRFGVILPIQLKDTSLADTFDGFGGGASRERKLAIMRDSSIGTFGTCALIASFALKWSALASIADAIQAALALIAAHVEPEVIEVFGDEAKAWAGAHGRRLSSRLEMAGETAFCYATDPRPLLAALAHASGLRYLHRPANLEDVFLKLTGRELRD